MKKTCLALLLLSSLPSAHADPLHFQAGEKRYEALAKRYAGTPHTTREMIVGGYEGRCFDHAKDNMLLVGSFTREFEILIGDDNAGPLFPPGREKSWKHLYLDLPKDANGGALPITPAQELEYWKENGAGVNPLTDSDGTVVTTFTQSPGWRYETRKGADGYLYGRIFNPSLKEAAYYCYFFKRFY